MQLESDTMTQKERLACLLNHQEPDRVPCYLMGWPEYSDFFQEFKSREAELFDPYTDVDQNILLTPSGDYTLNTFLGADIIVRGTRVDTPPYQWLDSEGKLSENPVIDKGQEQGDRETYGSVEKDQKVGDRITYFGKHERITILPNGYPYVWYEGGALRTSEKITQWFDTYGWPHELKVNDFGNDFNSTNIQFSKALHLIPSYGPGLYEAAWFMMGQDRFAWFTRKDPEFLMKLINSIKDHILIQIKKMKPLHPLAVISCDDMGQKGRPLISPAIHHKFFYNARKEIFDAIHDIGGKAIMHSCGNIVDLLPDLVSAGIDGWQTLEPASEIDFNALKQNYGDKLSFWGGIDNNVLCFGSLKDVENSVHQTLQILGKNGGYVLGPAHDYLNTKVDNALAMREALIKHGRYPLN